MFNNYNYIIYILGFPQPLIIWTKNGAEIQAKSGIKLSYDHNHVKLEIKDVKVRDAGRYTCAARNEVGNASSTADLVVKSKNYEQFVINFFFVVPV